MFTLFDLLELLGAVCGAMLGVALGVRYLGWVGGVAGAPLGLVVGYFLGRVPFVLSVALARGHVRRQSPEELRGFLRGPVWPAYHLVFDELLRRGEDFAGDVGVVLRLLVADDPQQRQQGWALLRALYPDQAAKLPDYNPEETAQACREKVEKSELSTG